MAGRATATQISGLMHKNTGTQRQQQQQHPTSRNWTNSISASCALKGEQVAAKTRPSFECWQASQHTSVHLFLQEACHPTPQTKYGFSSRLWDLHSLFFDRNVHCLFVVGGPSPAWGVVVTLCSPHLGFGLTALKGGLTCRQWA